MFRKVNDTDDDRVMWYRLGVSVAILRPRNIHEVFDNDNNSNNNDSNKIREKK